VGYTEEEADLTGNRMPHAPRVAGNLGAVQTWNFSADFRLRANMNVYYTSSFEGNGDNTPINQEHAYALTNASMSFLPKTERWSVALWCDNISNKLYWVARIMTPGAEFASQGAPRTYGVTLNAKY
jgi:iron complex outermembrane receptor protein